MRGIEAGSVDAIVTDPPYGLEFMGKEWDTHAGPREFQEWCETWAREALRVLKPGGHLLAFGGTRTYHRLACAIEDAGFEIRDCLAWLYGSGFPKSLNLDGDWQGWGTALKPAHEPIVLARKPLAGTVAGNVLAHGTGALNVDGCRVGAEVETWPATRSYNADNMALSGRGRGGDRPADRISYAESTGAAPPGRWPANVALDPEAAAMLDAQSGERPGGNYPEQRGAAQATGFGNRPTPGGARSMDDTGGASRFFYVAKAGSRERNAGLDGFPERTTRDTYGDGLQGPRPHTADDYEWQRKGARNVHPTVKPIELMRWLVRLVTPPGGLVLDPFMGSGTTGIACALEGMEFYGIEREAEYLRIAEARIAWWSRHRGEGSTAAILDAAETRHAAVAHGQLDLLEQASSAS